ncbi:MAG: ATP-binding protein, partial [Eubacterium sp.]|nr:ATP-binding protein [Eubacterium sp.]
YLTFVIMTNENSFSMITERAGEQPGSVDHFAKADFKVFMELFHYDFSEIESMLGIDCFSVLTDYKAIAKKENRYNRNVSDLVRSLSAKLAEAKDENEFFDLVTAHYRKYGVGMIGLNAAFRVQPLPQVREDDDEDRSRMRRGAEAAIFRNAGDVDLVPIYNTDKVLLSDLVGYELQKTELRRNTEAFLAGKASNNVLLYGDAGTGKSSSVKALINEYYDSGLRVIEIYKHQFKSLSAVLARIKNRNFRFIIFIDDLSFEENEVEYKYLKAVIEGGVEDRPENVVIYATSNRRHLVKETWKDRADMEHNGDVHRSDTVEEKLSLAARFGVKILYTIPRHNEFQEMVLAIARRRGLDPEEWPDEKILSGATAWERRAGGPTGRAAHQYITYLMAQ